MFSRLFLYFKNLDWIIFSAVILLVSFGLIEIYSISLGKGGLDLMNFYKQIIFIFIGLFAFFFFAFNDYHFLRSFSNYIYLLGLILLGAVLIFGIDVRGSRAWFSFGYFNLQPVEFAKIFLLIFLARFFSRYSLRINPLKNLFLSGLGVFVFVFLVLAQPDFGSACLLLVMWLFMLLVAGFERKYFLIIGLGLIISFILGWFFFFADYQKDRIRVFLNPDTKSIDQGYNISQAIIAVGSGGLTGRGVGFGSQSQLKFLPEAQNDFIFAVIAEELGFLGIVLLLTFFACFFFRSLWSLRKINNNFGVLFILGAVGLIFIEMFINIGMNIGILPVVGLSLPFVSYGGSSLLANFIIVGIIESIIVRSRFS